MAVRGHSWRRGADKPHHHHTWLGAWLQCHPTALHFTKTSPLSSQALEVPTLCRCQSFPFRNRGRMFLKILPLNKTQHFSMEKRGQDLPKLTCFLPFVSDEKQNAERETPFLFISEELLALHMQVRLWDKSPFLFIVVWLNISPVQPFKEVLRSSAESN